MVAPKLPPRRIPPERRASPAQQIAIASELADRLGRILAAWPKVQKAATQFLGGYPPALGLGTLGGGGDPTGDLAVARLDGQIHDIGVQANEWLAHFTETLAHVRSLDNALIPLGRVPESEVPRGRQNLVEVCDLCKLPAVKVRHVDDKVYHATSCYYRVYRAKRQVDRDA